MGKSGIEWTNATWNPVTGCDKVSSGCKNCYAETFSKRLKKMGQEKYSDGFNVRLHPDHLRDPLEWKSPRFVFVNSMSDLFHEEVPQGYIEEVFDTMRSADWHIFQVLTKRIDRVRELSSVLKWPDNVWMGVSVEGSRYKHRIRLLASTGASVKFLSLEPLLESVVPLQLEEIDWVIVGGESGNNPRPVRAEWVREIRDQCVRENVPFFFKQWGGANKKANGRELDGRTWDQLPSYNASGELALDL